MQAKRVIILHGNYGGTGQDAWIPWVKSELERAGLEVIAPTMPDNHEAKMSVWLPYLENVLRPDAETILIGWSSGAVAAMRYAEKHRVLGSVLVSAYHTDLGDALEKLGGWCEAPWDWEAIRGNQGWIVQFASTDDPMIPVDEPRMIRDCLQTDYAEIADGQHFGYPDPMPTFPLLVERILSHLHPAV